MAVIALAMFAVSTAKVQGQFEYIVTNGVHCGNEWAMVFESSPLTDFCNLRSASFCAWSPTNQILEASNQAYSSFPRINTQNNSPCTVVAMSQG